MTKSKLKILPKEEIVINEEKGVKESAELNNQGTLVKTSVPRILFEILLYGDDTNKDINDKVHKQLEEQFNKQRRNKHKVRALWYIDKGEKSEDEKIEWLLKNSFCKYYLIINLNDIHLITKDFVKIHLDNIRTLENAVAGIKSANIKVSKDKPKKS